MRRVFNIGAILFATMMLSVKSNHDNNDRAFEHRAYDTVERFVTFSMENAKIVNSRNGGLDFYYHDMLAYGHPVVIAGKETRLLLNEPALLLEASDKQTPFLIFPGEKINIRYAGSDSVQMYVQGNPQRTNELGFFRELVKRTGNIYYGWKVMPYHKKVTTLANIHELEKAINNVKNTRLQFLNSYSQKFPLSNSFNKIAANTIKSTAFTDSLLLYFNNRDMLSKQNLYKKLIAEKVTAIQYIGFMPFQVYYRSCTVLVAMATGNGLDYVVNSPADFTKKFDFIEKNFGGTTKDFLMATTIYNAYANNVQVSKEYEHRFIVQCADIGYRKIIDNKLHDKQTMVYARGSNDLLSTDGKTTRGLQNTIAKYRGKVILIDFWASWCAPCRKEMPYSVILKKSYEGKNVAFMYISKDEDVNNWLKANKEEALGNNNSFLLLNADKSSFVKQYNINAIPHYMLIGKDGKMINADAPRPSDPKLKLLIEKYL